jgi:hypothetical protein
VLCPVMCETAEGVRMSGGQRQEEGRQAGESATGRQAVGIQCVEGRVIRWHSSST